MANHDIIVIGTSSGGIYTLRSLVAQFKSDLAASIFIVQHVAPGARDFLAPILRKSGPLEAVAPADGDPIRKGVIYVAPPDHHMVIHKETIRLTKGPHENRFRPSIDPLFRSAAAYHGSRTIGVILTGMLDDGAAGLGAIRRCGGITVVQDPADALYPDMPNNALATLNVDYTVPVAELGALLERLVNEPVSEEVPIPRDIIIETEIAERAVSDTNIEDSLGSRAPFSCPECGGPLWQINDSSVQRYRCQTGHAFTAAALSREPG